MFPFASANPRDDAGSMSSPTLFTLKTPDSGSELYPAKGEGGRLDRVGGDK